MQYDKHSDKAFVRKERRLTGNRRNKNIGGYAGFSSIDRRVNDIADRRAETGPNSPKTTGSNIEGSFVIPADKNKQELNPSSKVYKDLGRKMNFYTFRFHVNSLKGRILTILDASIVNEKQHKAMKDLIEAEFYEQLKRGRETLYGGLVEPETMPSLIEGGGAGDDCGDTGQE